MAGEAAASNPSPATGERATLLSDGAFEHHGRGWQLGEGFEIVTGQNAPTPQVLHVKHRGSSSTRAVIRSPLHGRTYTVHGFLRTRNVTPLDEGGGAVMSLERFEFAGRQVGGAVFAKLTGTQDWTPFSYTFRCEPTAWWNLPVQPSVIWLELSLGLYRAGGEAWFAGLTIVEGDQPANVSEVVPREEQKGHPAPGRDSLAAVAIWRDQVPVEGAASDPVFIGSVLKQTGYDVEFVTSDELADPRRFTRQRFDIVVLPYGASFPAPATAALQAFLGQGGSFFSTGGYAFNNPLLRAGDGWITERAALAAGPGIEMVPNDRQCANVIAGEKNWRRSST